MALPDSIGKTPQTPFDVLILGGGHAGLSAATTLYRQQHTMAIFDDQKPRNSWGTTVRVMPNWENKDQEYLRELNRREIAATGLARLIKERITNVQKQDDSGFKVTDTAGRNYFGRKLLIATGAEFVFPEIEGYAELFPERIFHCMFTFGYEQRGSESAALLAQGSLSSVRHAMMVVQDTAKFAKKVFVYTNGNQSLGEELRASLAAEGVNGEVDDRRIERLSKGSLGTQIVIKFEDGEEETRDFLVHQPSTTPPPWITEQLQLEHDLMGNIKTNGFFNITNVPGVYAAGDCASPFKIIPNALYMGANAGAGVARELPRSLTGNDVDMTTKFVEGIA